MAALTALLETHREGARERLYPYGLESPIAIDKMGADPFEPADEYVYWPN